MLCRDTILNGMVVEVFGYETYPPDTTNVRPSIFIVNFYAPQSKDQGNAVSIAARGPLNNTREPKNIPRYLLIDKDALANRQTYQINVRTENKFMN